MTVLVIVIVILVLAGIGFGIYKLQQKKATDKIADDAKQKEMIEVWKAKQGQSGFSGGGLWKRKQ